MNQLPTICKLFLDVRIRTNWETSNENVLLVRQANCRVIFDWFGYIRAIRITLAGVWPACNMLAEYDAYFTYMALRA